MQRRQRWKSARRLATLAEPAPASASLQLLASLLGELWKPIADGDPFASRERRARGAVADVIEALRAAHAAHHDPEWTFPDLAGAVRRAIEASTFAADEPDQLDLTPRNVSLVDDQAARYGSFDHLIVVGLIENEWPEAGSSEHLLSAPAVESARMAVREGAARGGRGSLSRPPGLCVAFRRALDDYARRRSASCRGRRCSTRSRARGFRPLPRSPRIGGQVFDDDALLDRAAGPGASGTGAASMGGAADEPSFGGSSRVPRRSRPERVGLLQPARAGR